MYHISEFYNLYIYILGVFAINLGSYKPSGRRGSAHIKDSDGTVEGKPLRRGGSHEVLSLSGLI